MSKPVYALVGHDPFLQLERLKAIRQTLPADIETVDFDGERCALVEVLDELRSFAMFGGGKLVLVRQGDEFITRFREPLEAFLSESGGALTSTLVLRCNALNKSFRITKVIAKVGSIEPCDPPKPSQLPRWVIERGRTHHEITVEPAAANLLAENFGDDIGRIDNELAKLALQVDPAKNARVTAELVASSVTFQREQDMWVLSNELGLGDYTAALQRWRQLVELTPAAEFRAVMWLTIWLEETATILAGGDTRKLSWKYGDRFSQVIRTAKTMGWVRHATTLRLLAEADRRTKSGLGSAESNVEQFILQLAGEQLAGESS